jgi:hypothetical protein
MEELTLRKYGALTTSIRGEKRDSKQRIHCLEHVDVFTHGA